jgi:hypothetical protein
MARNLPTAFPFYEAVTEQYRYRADVEEHHRLIVSSSSLLPFIIRATHHDGLTANDITIDLYDADTNTKLTAYHWHGVASNGFVIEISEGTSYDYIYHVPSAISSPELPIGSFYMVVTHPLATYYSEVFYIVSSLSDCIRVDFANNTTIAGIAPYFYQTLYLKDDSIKTPDYIREDTGEKRNGILVKEKQVVIKSEILRILLAPEYWVDALILLPLMDNVYVTPVGGLQTSYGEVKIKDPEWVESSNGTRAKLEIQLLTVVAIKKLNFKEMGYTETTEAIIKQGVGVTASTGGLCFLQVTFTEEMPDTNYTPSVPYCVSTASPNNAEVPWIGNILKTGFVIYSLIPCNVRWSAIHV